MDRVGNGTRSKGGASAAAKSRWLRLVPHLLVGLLVLLLLVLDSYRTSAAHLGGPFYDLDGLHDDVWLDSSIRLVVDRPMSLPEVERTFRIEPRPGDCSRCLSVTRVGLTSWDDWAPWAETTVVFNPDRRKVFQPDTDYTLWLLGKRFQFRTIAVPKAVRFFPSPDQRGVATMAPIEIEFDRLLADNPRHLVTIEPDVPFVPHWQGHKVILEHERLRCNETYRVTVWPGVRDSAGHPSQEPYSFAFTTVESPRIVAVQPSGDARQSVFSQVVVLFDRPMHRASVEKSFRVEPPASGSLRWQGDSMLVWKPWALLYSTAYRVSLGGHSQAGDPLAEDFSWQFRTQDPPPLTTRSDDGTIVLTFDDQGSKAQVEDILNVLAEKEVKAIFFPVGKWAEQNKELIDRMEAEGHLVGNHTYSHAHLANMTEDEIRSEIEHGAGRDLLRLPYGERNALAERVAEELGYRIYGWNVDPADWKGGSAQQIVETVIREVRPGSVIVLHLQGKHTGEALKHLIPLLRQAGYKFWRPEGLAPEDSPHLSREAVEDTPPLAIDLGVGEGVVE